MGGLSGYSTVEAPSSQCMTARQQMGERLRGEGEGRLLYTTHALSVSQAGRQVKLTI